MQAGRRLPAACRRRRQAHWMVTFACCPCLAKVKMQNQDASGEMECPARERVTRSEPLHSFLIRPQFSQIADGISRRFKMPFRTSRDDNMFWRWLVMCVPSIEHRGFNIENPLHLPHREKRMRSSLSVQESKHTSHLLVQEAFHSQFPELWLR